MDNTETYASGNAGNPVNAVVAFQVNYAGHIIPKTLDAAAWHALFPKWTRFIAMDLHGAGCNGNAPLWVAYENEPKHNTRFNDRWRVKSGRRCDLHTNIQPTHWATSLLAKPEI